MSDSSGHSARVGFALKAWASLSDEGHEHHMPKVLIVEDSSLIQMYYRQIFAKLPGYQPSFTKNGREALDHIGKHGMPDVVVLDINMPVMDGLEFLAHFKGDRNATPARVVIVTTEGRAADFKRGLAAG